MMKLLFSAAVEVERPTQAVKLWLHSGINPLDLKV